MKPEKRKLISRACLIIALGMASSNMLLAAEPTAITLDDAIRTALKNHGSIVNASESWTAAKQRIIQARSATLPSVSVSVSQTLSGNTSKRSSTTGGLLGTFRSNSTNSGIQPQISVDYTLWDGGLTRANVRQANANANVSLQSLEATKNSLAFTVSQDYYNQLLAEKLLDLRKEQVKLAGEQLKSVQARASSGAAADADTALPLSELRNREVDLVQAQNDLIIAANNLRNSMGLDIGDALTLSDATLPNQPTGSIAELYAVSERSRPEIAEAKSRVEAAEAAVTATKVQKNPKLVASAGYANTPNDDTTHQNWQVGAAISMPIFDGGLTTARVKEAQANLRSAEASYIQTKKDVASEVDSAFNNLKSAIQRVDAANVALDAARISLKATTERYAQGAIGITVVDVITAQVQYATAANNNLQAKYSAALSKSQLDQAMGLLASGKN